MGLTTALLLQEEGHQVTVVAQHFPGDMSTTQYTSPWAGANWCGGASSDCADQQAAEAVTLAKLFRLSVEAPEAGVKVVDCIECATNMGPLKLPWFTLKTPQFRLLKSKERPVPCDYAYSYKSVCINTPLYLQWLRQRYEATGGRCLRVSQPISHIADLWTAHPETKVIVNCSGLSARDLGGVRDPGVYPIRGQTLLVRAPLSGQTLTAISPEGVSYVIPRGDGTVVIGGTYQQFSEKAEPDEDTIEHILTGCLRLAPGLVADQDQSFDSRRELLRQAILRVNVGFRPARIGGARVEVEEVGGTISLG
ncbi:hypothetical protein IWQ60_002971 [Tieghemiomyces parasiticus]|uniref:FAD dependent oxidoreductase domain-containing protein n=1 Tax=Tieghemiomyces parasiticus TaxID=78921 RepID=A0A9W8AGG0_9FUNG|nr:hypothetical protein IWQ60_002971 [Tieghemiomyces parasiticus]